MLPVSMMLMVCACAPMRPANAAPIEKGPYLQQPTTTGITVCWVSSTAVTGRVAYAPIAASGAVGRYTAVPETRATRYHRVTIRALRAYTRYAYRVECEGATAPGTFITAAPKGHAFRFAAYGDTRTQPDKHAAVLAQMALFKPDFVLQSGDLVANGLDEAQWTVFFATAEAVLRNTPYYPVLGNHEKSGSPYFRYFPVPRDYAFDYGDVHVVGLDSNRPAKEIPAQEAWLRRDLAQHQSAKWRIVFMHHTPVTCVVNKGRREAADRLRARVEPILKEGRVQLVLTGHDHNYQRHVVNDITYVVSGGGGAPLYDVRLDTPFVRVAVKVHHHCEFDVRGNAMTCRVVQSTGAVIDSFTLQAME